MTYDDVDKKDGTPSEGTIISMNLSALNVGKGSGRSKRLDIKEKKKKKP